MSDATTNEAAAPVAPEMPSSARLILTLGLIAMMSGLCIVLTYQFTKPIIDQNKREAREKAVASVLPEVAFRNYYFLDESGLKLLEPSHSAEANITAGYGEDGKLTGLALEGEARGYADVVVVLYGYDPTKEQVIGMTILQSTETPGLGDRAGTDPVFLANFDALDARLTADGSAVAHPIETVKNGAKENAWEIDAISGATVTSKAVGNALRSSTNELLPLLAKYRDSLAMTYER